jgi:hypothetical protein
MMVLGLVFDPKKRLPMSSISAVSFSLVFALTPGIKTLIMPLSTAVSRNVLKKRDSSSGLLTSEVALTVAQNSLEAQRSSRAQGGSRLCENDRTPWMVDSPTRHLNFAYFDQLRRMVMPLSLLLTEPIEHNIRALVSSLAILRTRATFCLRLSKSFAWRIARSICNDVKSGQIACTS